VGGVVDLVHFGIYHVRKFDLIPFVGHVQSGTTSHAAYPWGVSP
jgi:hypothetical protein